MRQLHHLCITLVGLLLVSLSLGAAAFADNITTDADNSIVSAQVGSEISIWASTPDTMTLTHFGLASSAGSIAVVSTQPGWTVTARDTDQGSPGQLDRSSGTGPSLLDNPLGITVFGQQLFSLTGSDQEVFTGVANDQTDLTYSQALSEGEDVLSGDAYGLTVTYSVVAGSGGSEPPPSGPSNSAPSLVSAPEISGTVAIGEQLSSSSGQWSGWPTPSYGYQWLTCSSASDLETCTNASGTGNHSSSYTVDLADAGSYLRVQVTASNGVGSPASATSDATSMVLLEPSASGSLTLPDSKEYGTTITSSSTLSWSGSPSPSVSYQWQGSSDNSSWSDIASATNTSYAIPNSSAQIGRYLRLRARGSNAAGSADAYSSTARVSGLVNAAAPTITGTTLTGQNLSASSGSWTSYPSVSSYGYQWRVCTSASDLATCSNASGAGATSSSYTVAVADAGQYLRVRVTASNGTSASQSSTSDATSMVTDPPANSVLPVISGTVASGQQLSTTSGTWSGTPSPQFAYQWEVSANGTSGWTSASGTGNASSTYTVAAGDVGQYLRVKVTASNAAGEASVYSLATGQVPYPAWGATAVSATGSGTNYDYGYSVSPAPDGSTYVAGNFAGTATFGSTTLTSNNSNPDAFVAKLSSSGSWQWAVAIGSNSADEFRAVEALPGGGAVVLGGIRGTSGNSVAFGSTTLTTTGLADIVAAKIDSSGNWVWATKVTAAGDDYGYDLALASDGSLVATGYMSTSNSATFGSITLPAVSGTSHGAFVAKFNSGDGSWVWATRATTTTGSIYGYGVAFASDGSVRVSGQMSGPSTFGSISRTASGTTDGYVAKLSGSGTWQWVTNVGVASYQNHFNHVAGVADGAAVIAGNTVGTVSYGSTTFTNGSTSRPLVAKVDADGNFVWATRVVSTGGEAHGVRALPDGNLAMSGEFTGTNISFGGNTLTGPGMFVSKVNASTGALVWGTKGGTSSSDYGYNLAVRGDGTIFATGSFAGANRPFGSTNLTAGGYGDIFVGRLNSSGAWSAS